MLCNRDSNRFVKWWFSLDHNILLAIFLIILFGLIASYSSSPAVAERIGLSRLYFFNKHLIFVALFFIIMLTTSSISPFLIRRMSLLGSIFVVISVILILLISPEFKGAKRWIRVFSISIQPTEFLKVFFIIINAWFLSRRFDLVKYKAHYFSLMFFTICAILLILQPDIGMLLNFSFILGIQFFLFGISIISIFLLMLISIFSLVILYFSFSHVKYRIDKFLFSEGEPTYQVKRSLEAIDNGGLYGQGLLEGTVKNNLPDSHTDFVFATIIEEFGILGSSIIILLFLYLVFRIFHHLKYIENPFKKIALISIAAQISFQIFVNIGVNLNLLPTKGTTLPMISYGGSSMLANAILIGILLSFTRKLN